MHLKMSSAKWRPFCLGLNVLTISHAIAQLSEPHHFISIAARGQRAVAMWSVGHSRRLSRNGDVPQFPQQLWRWSQLCLAVPVGGRQGNHYSDVIMSAMASQITGVSMFAQLFVQAQIKENFEAPRHWPLWGEFTGHRWIPLTRGQ